MDCVLFSGEKHRITTDGKAFFLYFRSIDNEDEEWELLDKNEMEGSIYNEALRSIKIILSMDLPEEEKMLKICETGFFKFG